MFNTVYAFLLPKTSGKPYENKVQFVFRQQIQPWHPSSTLVHEAGVAALRLAPGKFWDFSQKLFEAQKEYFDANVVNEGRNETYGRLAKLAASVGVDEGRTYEMLSVSEKPGKDGGLNTGNQVTDDLKVLVKVWLKSGCESRMQPDAKQIARLTGIHVSPTIVFDGVVENSISSSFTAGRLLSSCLWACAIDTDRMTDQWDEWLTKNCSE